ncbi:MAG TPA: cytochrome P460 family protein [Pyrinomonadaceae bacterium]|nr:cytochrome P460 family protein [Pyrinomonadaceae bacterium]
MFAISTIIIIGLQFVRPVLQNSPVTGELQAPAALKQILRNSCYDCHSNETRLSWFDQIVPAYWLVVANIRKARGHLNFSELTKINPWPDGTIFAKVAWDRLTDDKGQTQLGQFKQVEFMIKDSKNYASTLGWGFARWRGFDLKPFGQDATFTKGCVGCHNPMRANDYVFTQPIKGEE